MVARFLKWAGPVLCLVAAWLYVADAQWTLGDRESPDGFWIVRFEGGVAHVHKAIANVRVLADPDSLDRWARHGGVSGGQREDVARIPLWAPMACFALMTLWAWHYCWARSRPGHCKHCGCDLGRPPYSLVCPGCGKERR